MKVASRLPGIARWRLSVSGAIPATFSEIRGNSGSYARIQALSDFCPAAAQPSSGVCFPAIDRIPADLKLEAAYFFAGDSGQRTVSIVFDVNGTSRIPAVAEPGFSRSMRKFR
jgi:hypothetical protein